ncbi:MAG: CDC27 family protein [Acidimicrobiales bacterium]|nr:CDC27 family protein [Acidimicrobiales bacterium]
MSSDSRPPRARPGGPSKGRTGDQRNSSGPPRGGAGKGGPRHSDGDRDPRGRDERGSKKPGERLPDRDLAGPAKWGRIARRGAGNMNYEEPTNDNRPNKRPPERRSQKEAEVRDGPSRPDRTFPTAADLERTAASAVKRGRASGGFERKPLAARASQIVDPAVSLRRMVGEPRSTSLSRRLRDASKAFESERFKDTIIALRPVVREAPELPEARELMGLAHYRTGKWKEAIEHLEAFREISGSTEQHPVLADCHRAMKHWTDVDDLWAELGDSSPNAELVVEGRIVAAGARADRGEVEAAIGLLAAGWKVPKRPQPHHLRRAYALADLYDRAGRAPRARELFAWVASHDKDLADVQARVRALG